MIRKLRVQQYEEKSTVVKIQQGDLSRIAEKDVKKVEFVKVKEQPQLTIVVNQWSNL